VDYFFDKSSSKNAVAVLRGMLPRVRWRAPRKPDGPGVEQVVARGRDFLRGTLPIFAGQVF